MHQANVSTSITVSLYPLDEPILPSSPFIYYPRFDFQSKPLLFFSPKFVAAFKPRLVSFSRCCTRDTTNHHPYLIGREPREADLLQYPKEFHSAGRRWFGLASLSCLFPPFGKVGGGAVEIGGDTPIIREMQLRRLGGLRTYRGYVARARAQAAQDSAVRQDPLRSLTSSLITDAAVPSSAVRIFDIAQLA